jgi:hypothetical protein
VRANGYIVTPVGRTRRIDPNARPISDIDLAAVTRKPRAAENVREPRPAADPQLKRDGGVRSVAA